VSDAVRDRVLARLATPEGREHAIRHLMAEGYTAEQARLFSDPDVQRCINPHTLDDVLCCYGTCPTDPETPPASPSPRRNTMKTRPSTTTKPSQETLRRLEAASKDLRELTARANRRVVEEEVGRALEDGRIGADEQERWFERAEKFGVDVVRDLLRERRPDRQLAAANARTEISAEQDRQLAEVFPGYEPRSS
jgi:hypothetical protein